jgi:hypothetical protein
MSDIAQLPWPILVTLACGYAAYSIASLGYRSRHSQSDVVFSVLLFGFLSQVVYQGILRVDEGALVWATLAAFVIAILLGSLWRKYGRRIFRSVLRWLSISFSENTQKGFPAPFLMEPNLPPTQICVWTKDGCQYSCDSCGRFLGKPFGPFVYSEAGDIWLYATHFQPSPDAPDAEVKDVESPHAEWGTRVTYIPADNISRVTVRFADQPYS